MKTITNNALLIGLLKKDQKVIEVIARLTLNDLMMQIKFLMNTCMYNSDLVVLIANRTFKDQLMKFRMELITNIKPIRNDFNNDSILIRCIDGAFLDGDIWVCLEKRIDKCIDQAYYLYKKFQEKRKLKKDIIFGSVVDKIIEGLKLKIKKTPRKKHDDGLLYTICSNKVKDFLKTQGEEVEYDDDPGSGFSDPMLIDKWESECRNYLAQIMSENELDDFYSKSDEKYNILLEYLQEKAGLTENEKQILLLLKVSGESHKEIAEMLGLTGEDSSKSLEYRAMKKIRKCFNIEVKKKLNVLKDENK